MTSYQASLHRDKEKKLIISNISEKDIANPMFIIDEDSVSILDVYDQNLGKTTLFISGKQATLTAFLDGFKLGLKQETI